MVIGQCHPDYSQECQSSSSKNMTIMMMVYSIPRSVDQLEISVWCHHAVLHGSVWIHQAQGLLCLLCYLAVYWPVRFPNPLLPVASGSGNLTMCWHTRLKVYKHKDNTGLTTTTKSTGCWAQHQQWRSVPLNINTMIRRLTTSINSQKQGWWVEHRPWRRMSVPLNGLIWVKAAPRMDFPASNYHVYNLSIS